MFFLICITKLAYCNGSVIDDSILVNKTHFQIAVGGALTNFSYPNSTYLNQPVYFLHAGFSLRKPLKKKYIFELEIASEPVGVKYESTLK
jgi:hypothetical protein